MNRVLVTRISCWRFFALQPFEVSFYRRARFRYFKTDGIETVIFRTMFCFYLPITVRLLDHVRLEVLERIGKRPGFSKSPFEVEVHQMAVTIKHFIYKLIILSCLESFQPLISQYRIFVCRAFPIELGDEVQSVAFTPIF